MDTVQEERFYYGYYEHPKMRLIVLIRGFRYLHNVADARVAHHIERGWEDGLLVSSVASCQNLWTLILDSGTGFTSQVYKLSPGFLDEVCLILLPLNKKKFSLNSPFIFHLACGNCISVKNLVSCATSEGRDPEGMDRRAPEKELPYHCDGRT